MPTGALVLLWCDGCAAERAFEAPPCVDGHGEDGLGDCPELACVDCGAAVVVPTPASVAGPPLHGALVRAGAPIRAAERLLLDALVDDPYDDSAPSTRRQAPWALPRSA
jgi:hypothetical protein